MRFELASVLVAALLAGAPAPGGEGDASRKIEALIRQLGAEDYVLREKATKELRKLGPVARKHLERASASKDPEIRERAGMLLKEIIWKLPPKLKARLGEFGKRFDGYLRASEDQRLRLLVALRSRAPRQAEGFLLEAAREQTSHRAQAWLVDLLKIYRSAAAEDAILAVSRRKDRYCRSSAAAALAGYEAAKSTKRLLELADDDEAPVRRAAIEALGRRGPFAAAAAAKTVVARLTDADETVRAAAAGAAGRIGIRAARKALWKLTADAEISVRVEAIQAIGQTAGPKDENAVKGLSKLLDDPMPAVRAIALQALIDMRATSVVPRLVKLLGDGDSEIAASAAGGLAVLGDKRQFADLRRVLTESEDGSLVVAAGRALVILGDKESLPRVARLMFGKNAVTAKVAAQALGLTGDVKWVPELVKAERHWKAESFSLASLEVRNSRLRDPAALKPLAEKLSSQRGGLTWAFMLSGCALFSEAEDIFSASARTSLDEPSMLSRLGIAQLQAGRGEQGMAKLLQAAEMNPFHAVNLNNCAWFLLTASDGDRRDAKKGLRLAARAARLEPRAGYILDTYAWALYRNGKTKEALAQIDSAIRWARPDNPGENSVLRVHRARMLSATGERDAAIKELAAVLAEFPRDPELAAEAARAYCDLGLVRKALDELKRMVDLNYPDAYILKHDPELAAARGDPGFAALLKHAAKVRKRVVDQTGAARAAREERNVPPLGIELR